mmetsp:Transcript_23146/g.51088  ORF Transcript_23146/g.51088 Transcript_23146/m.51088 type:complete len:193 (+) Transcript_23146:3-581(+)
MALHYAFKSSSTAKTFATVVRSALYRVGPSVFVATTTDRRHILSELEVAGVAAKPSSLQNAFFSVRLAVPVEDAIVAEYGAECRFSLAGAVDDCKEYLMDVDTLRYLLNVSEAGAAKTARLWSDNMWDFPGCLLDDAVVDKGAELGAHVSDELRMEALRLARGPYGLDSRHTFPVASAEVCRLYRTILALVK